MSITLEKANKNSISSFFGDDDALWAMIPDGCDGYMFGGCRVAALGIQEYLKNNQIPSKLMGVWDQDIIEHVIVKANGVFIDSEGLNTAGEIIAKIEHFSFKDGLRIAPVSAADLNESDMWLDSKAIQYISEQIEIENLSLLKCKESSLEQNIEM